MEQTQLTPKETIEQEVEDIFVEIDKITSKVYLDKYTFPNNPTVARIKHLAKVVITLRKLKEEMDSFEPEELPY